MTITRADLLHYLDDLLDCAHIRDCSHNGCQVAGRTQINRIASAATASLAAIEAACAAGAEALLVHHGLIWGNIDRIDDLLQRRLAPLLAADCNLLAYHLPLDGHPTIGNNAHILRVMGAEDIGGFGDSRTPLVGRIGLLPEAVTIKALAERCATLFEHAVIHCPGGPTEVRRIGAVSGGGQSFLLAAAEAECEVLITGETSEQTWHESSEAGIHCLACGHHATERFAIHDLAADLAERFNLTHLPIDVPNPL